MNLVTTAWKRMGSKMRWRLLYMKEPKFLMGVQGLILNPQGEILLLKHRFWPNQAWGLPGGWAKRRESFAETLARELHEEIGIAIADAHLINMLDGKYFRYGAILKAHTEHAKPASRTYEILDAQFFKPSELPNNLFFESRNHIKHAIEHKFI